MTIQIVDKVTDKSNDRKSEIATQDGYERELTSEEMNDVFKEIIPSKRGSSYDLGSVSECRYASMSTTPSPMITNLQTQLQSMQEELRTTKKMMAQQKLDFEAKMEAMKEESDAQLEA